MSQAWDSGRCNETSGFLFRHACGGFPKHACQQCAKPLCDDHAHETGSGLQCTTCARGQRSSQSVRHNDPYYDDPYFYGDHYYHGYGRYSHGYWGHRMLGGHGHRHDPHDFTEADADSLQHVGDEDFENDMSES